MKRLAAILALAACNGESGTIEVALTTAPGSTVLDPVQTLRMTITNPRQVFTARRSTSGFDIAVDLPASGELAALLVDGLDASGTVIASGASPQFSFGGIDGRVVVYMAAPNSMDVAPTALEPARSEIGAGILPYGAVFAGGRLATGTPSDAVQIYNAFDHSLLSGMALPAPRAGLALGVGNFGVYFFGGTDATNTITSTLWRFDTAQPPAGIYYDYGEKNGLARTGEHLIATGNERFLLTGAPAAELIGLDGSFAFLDGIAGLPSTGVSVIANDGVLTSLFVGSEGVIRCRSGACAAVDAVPGRTGATIVALPGGKAGVLCASTTALRVDATTGTAEPIENLPTIEKTGCAAAVTSRHLVIAGGTSATGADAAVEIFDAATLAPVATASLAVPRSGATAIALPNDQVLVVGGTDVSGMPTATIELFTPANP